MQTESCDLAVIGGGINGAGIARDAAGRGLRVVLIEREDIAQHTSSASTKLIHGGLRYLEQFEFGLVRKSLAEREVLLANAPHIIRPMRFVMPQTGAARPAWMVRAGLFLYDHLARRDRLPASTGVDLRTHVAGEALQSSFTQGFEYSDAWVDDARLVLLNCMDAHERGATILTRTACTAARREADGWHLSLAQGGMRPWTLRARAVVNATGPWAASFLLDHTPVVPRHRVRLVRGSHIVVPAMFGHDHAYLMQNPDGRVIFAIPFERRFTLIGTTEAEHASDPGIPRISATEIAYLCAAVGRFFRNPPRPGDVLWTYSGVRPLLDDGSQSATQVTRDYALDLDLREGAAPLLSIFGGKLTTYRVLAEEALAQLLPALGNNTPAWTAHAPLPGGNLPDAAPGQASDQLARLRESHPQLPAALLQRWSRAYGSRTELLLDGRQGLAQLGEEVLPGLYAREIDYLIDNEWARSAQDVLWRRTKLGLHYLADGIADAETRLDHWMMERIDGDRR